MKRIFSSICFLLLVVANLLTAQGWMRTFGGPKFDSGSWLEITTDSGFIIAGDMEVELSTLSFPWTEEYGYVVKTNPMGYAEWTRTYRSEPGAFECSFYSIQLTADGGYVLLGEALSFVDERLSKDLWLMKIDSGGFMQWSRIYGAGKEEEGFVIRETHDGGFICAGESGEQGEKDLWVLRTDSLGDTLWTRIIGDEGLDRAVAIIVASDGNYVVAGQKASGQAWLLKMNDDGDVLWENSFGNDAWAISVCESPDGGYVLTGEEGFTVVPSELYIVKTDSDGNEVWSRTFFGGDADKKNVGRCIIATLDGGFALVAYKNEVPFGPYDGWLIKLDSLGETMWSQTLIFIPDGKNGLRCIKQTVDGGYVITGTVEGDVLLVKTDSLGYVPIVEDQIEIESNVDTSAPLGKPVEIRYTNMPGGFHAYVFDVTGRKVDELHSSQTQGTVSWPVTPVTHQFSPGVYFIRELSEGTSHKVVLIR